MTKRITISLIVLLTVVAGFSQQPVLTKVKPVSYHQLVAAGPALPLAGFGETHFGGITASYIRKHVKYPSRETLTRKKTSWITAASLSHYFGKKEKIGTNSFRYRHYSLLDVQGGMAWYPLTKMSFSLRTGPGLGYYNKIFRFTVTGQIHGSYAIGPKTIITPGFAFIKEPGSDALWITSLQLGCLF